MIRVFRWFIGFVEFTFSDGFTDGFLNDCYGENRPVRNLCYVDGALCGECPAAEYLTLCRIAKRHGGRLKIKKKKGAVFPLLKIKNRLGIFAGAVAFAVILSFLSGFVWDIQITGNSRISDETVNRFLAQNGLHCGVYKKSIEKDKIENLMMASFDDCAWVHINELGTTVRVEINETKQPPEIVNRKGVANVKAAQDGIIVKTTVHDGWPAVKVGDSVSKGDLLISGVYESEDKKHRQYAHARGKCIAQVTEEFELVVNRTQSEAVITGRDSYKTLTFFGLNIPLYFGGKNLHNAAQSNEYKYIKINEKNIPAGIIYTEVRHYSRSEKTLSDKELASLCKSETENKIKTDYADCTVIGKSLSTEITADAAVVKGTVTCLKDIGKETKVKK